MIGSCSDQYISLRKVSNSLNERQLLRCISRPCAPYLRLIRFNKNSINWSPKKLFQRLSKLIRSFMRPITTLLLQRLSKGLPEILPEPFCHFILLSLPGTHPETISHIVPCAILDIFPGTLSETHSHISHILSMISPGDSPSVHPMYSFNGFS